MAELRWTPQAADDLEAITNFIAADSPHYASLFAIDVLTSVERLQVFPRSGRIVPELHAPDIREIILGRSPGTGNPSPTHSPAAPFSCDSRIA